jgi:GTP pyrophosphokinase
MSSSIDLYCLIYQEKIDLLEIKRFLTVEPEKADDTRPQPLRPQAEKPSGLAEEEVLMLDNNLRKVNYKLAKCCNPVPGDHVFGFVTISRGISIHKISCPNADQLLTRFGYRKIDVRWKGFEGKDSSRVTIQVTGKDRIGVMNEISQIISNDMKVNILGVKIDVRKGEFNGVIKLQVNGDYSIFDLLQRISRIPGINKAVQVH